MGYSLSWLAIKGKSPQAVRDELGFKPTGEREEVPEADYSAAELPNGWYVIISDHTEQVVPDPVMQRLSSGDCELVTCFVEEHVMCSSAAGWKNGHKYWSVTHDAQRGSEHLITEGDLPPAFNSIRDDLFARQREGKRKCDYIFDIPVETAKSVAGYRHDKDVEGLTGDAFEILEWNKKPQPLEIKKPQPFWKKLFSK